MIGFPPTRRGRAERRPGSRYATERASGAALRFAPAFRCICVKALARPATLPVTAHVDNGRGAVYAFASHLHLGNGSMGLHLKDLAKRYIGPDGSAVPVI